MRSIVASVAAALILVASAAQVDAAPITYEFWATGSGQIGLTSFTDKNVLFNGTTDTGDVATISFMGLTFYAVGLNNMTVNIAGVGTAVITDLAKIIDIPQPIVDPDGDIPALPGLMLMRI